MQKLLVIAALVTWLLAATPAATAVEPRASLPDIEDEVMCPTCGTPLSHAFSPQAERQRRFIRQQINQGRTKQEIKDALVAEFGEEVLATPGDEGFDLAAYLVPVAVIGLAGCALVFGLSRWRRPNGDAGDAGAEVTPAESARLEQDLSRYDP